MTSQINPATIDGNYPIAGVPNNTQGMRDNFTAIKTNFQYAETEIDDLQSKGVFKAALTGTTLDNNMANNLIYNARIQGFSGTLVQIANTTGAITVDCSAGHVQTIVMGGNITVSFTTATWPAAGSVGIVRLIITVDTANRTMTLPANVSLGTTGIQGYSANVITFAAAGTYEFGFLTYDQGTTITLFDYNRPLNYYTNPVTIAANTVSTSATTGALTVAGGLGIGGNLYVTGDIFGNVTLTDISVGTVTATGNVVGGNINTAGLVTATGNVTGGNIRTGGVISAAGNIALGSGASIGVGTTTPDTEVTILGYPQTSTYTLVGNSTTAGTDLHIVGADSANTRITQDAFGTGVYVAFTGRTARGTAATPTQTQSGDVLTQFTARGFSNGTLQFGNASTGRVDVVAGENFTDTSRATKILIYTTPTASITPVNTATFDSTGAFTATGNITGGNVLTAGLASATGNITGGNILSSAVISAVGNATILSGTAVPTGGTTGAGYKLSSTTNLGVFFGSGAPTLSAAQGSLYLRTDGTTTNNRMYVNTNGSTTWTAVTTVA